MFEDTLLGLAVGCTLYILIRAFMPNPKEKHLLLILRLILIAAILLISFWAMVAAGLDI
jgi:multisubunit Na+/H+ antiporter MnhE subunit